MPPACSSACPDSPQIPRRIRCFRAGRMPRAQSSKVKAEQPAQAEQPALDRARQSPPPAPRLASYPIATPVSITHLRC
jgi:hypothetical protein